MFARLLLTPSQSSTGTYFSCVVIVTIPSLSSLDPDQKDALVEVIEKLLKDQTTVAAITMLGVGLVVLIFSVYIAGGW